MLYRFHDCGIYDSNEPSTEAWVYAATAREAVDKITTLLALTWGVPADRVCLNSYRHELDLEENAVEGRDAGDRRLVATGSYGDYPTYFAVPVLIFLGARDHRRVVNAFAAARAHALELAAEFAMKARQERSEGREQVAEDRSWRAQEYLRFAKADFATPGDGS